MIEVKNLKKRYNNGYVAVDDVNFTIEKGQIVGFLGPNGAGKSTTMNIITGYISATEGNVSIDGHDIFKEPEQAKKHIGYLPEIPPLYLEMTVSEYLKFVAKLKGVKRKDIETLVEEVMRITKVIDMENRMIKYLSKGYKQRVGFAGALVGSPEVLILDEPTVGLDPKQIIEIRKLIKNLAQNHTIILSSHILQEISAVCDRIIIINKGKVVIDELMKNIDNTIADSECLFVEAKTTESNLKTVLKSVSNIDRIEMTESENTNCVCAKIYSKDIENLREKIFETFAKNNIVVLEMKIEKMSLEDIFLEATKEDYDAYNLDIEENVVSEEEIVVLDESGKKETSNKTSNKRRKK